MNLGSYLLTHRWIKFKAKVNDPSVIHLVLILTAFSSTIFKLKFESKIKLWFILLIYYSSTYLVKSWI